MRNIINWGIKLLFCWGLGFLAFRFLNPISLWMNSLSVLGVFLWYLLIFGYWMLFEGVNAIQRALGLDKEKKSLVRGILCALGGVPTTVICAVDVWNEVYYGLRGVSLCCFSYMWSSEACCFASVMVLKNNSAGKENRVSRHGWAEKSRDYTMTKVFGEQRKKRKWY